MKRKRARLSQTVIGMTLLAGATPCWSQAFSVVDLVSDDAAAHPAAITDAGLVNGWGMSYSPTSPFWVSSNRGGTVELYNVNPATQATAQAGLVVSIPGDGTVTGQAFNANAGSGTFNGNSFLFVSGDGTISGWGHVLGTTAETLVLGSPSHNYTGTALTTVNSSSYLVSADFRSGTIDVFTGTPVTPALSGTFTDPGLPSGFAPFDVQNLGGSLYVTYAKRDGTGTNPVDGAGFGFVDSFDLQGNFIGRVASQGSLDAPWGMAIAPTSFGALAGSLLVGNSGDGHISAFDLATHAFLGELKDGSGSALSIDGLKGLSVGNGGNGGSADFLYFTAGPDGGAHGVFGVLTPVPEPGTVALFALGLFLIVELRRRRATSP